MGAKSLTIEQENLVLDWHRAGCSARSIADHLGVGRTSVERCIRNGAAIMTPTDEVAELMSQGLSFAQIAAQLNMTLDAVKSAFKRIKRALGPQAR
jgi:DNA-binding CsgD family transcriptional regulator